PNENGLDFWTCNITGGCPQYNPPPVGCSTGVNDNNDCVVGGTQSYPVGKRVDVSRSFWVAQYGSWFNSSYGLTNFDPSPYATQNGRFLYEVYRVYLRRKPDDPPDRNLDGFNFWLTDLNSHGNPADQTGVNHIIDSFIKSTEY